MPQYHHILFLYSPMCPSTVFYPSGFVINISAFSSHLHNACYMRPMVSHLLRPWFNRILILHEDYQSLNVQDNSEGASASHSDVDKYIIIKKLLFSRCDWNLSHHTEVSASQNHSPVSVLIQDITYPKIHFPQAIWNLSLCTSNDPSVISAFKVT
jgi:hypothetical protein